MRGGELFTGYFPRRAGPGSAPPLTGKTPGPLPKLGPPRRPHPPFFSTCLIGRLQSVDLTVHASRTRRLLTDCKHLPPYPVPPRPAAQPRRKVLLARLTGFVRPGIDGLARLGSGAFHDRRAIDTARAAAADMATLYRSRQRRAIKRPPYFPRNPARSAGPTWRHRKSCDCRCQVLPDADLRGNCWPGRDRRTRHRQ